MMASKKSFPGYPFFPGSLIHILSGFFMGHHYGKRATSLGTYDGPLLLRQSN